MGIVMLFNLIGHGNDLGHSAVLLDVGSLECLDHPAIVVNPTLACIKIGPGSKRLLNKSKSNRRRKLVTSISA